VLAAAEESEEEGDVDKGLAKGTRPSNDTDDAENGDDEEEDDDEELPALPPPVQPAGTRKGQNGQCSINTWQ
jgi:hypothetical protein